MAPVVEDPREVDAVHCAVDDHISDALASIEDGVAVEIEARDGEDLCTVEIVVAIADVFVAGDRFDARRFSLSARRL